MESSHFRRQATAVFRLSVVTLALSALALTTLGWWIGRWWGLGIGIILGGTLLLVGLTTATLLYAMSQDGA